MAMLRCQNETAYYGHTGVVYNGTQTVSALSNLTQIAIDKAAAEAEAAKLTPLGEPYPPPWTSSMASGPVVVALATSQSPRSRCHAHCVSSSLRSYQDSSPSPRRPQRAGMYPHCSHRSSPPPRVLSAAIARERARAALSEESIDATTGNATRVFVDPAAAARPSPSADI